MADFCKQCSIDHFGKDYQELAGLFMGPLQKDHGILCICEGCGYILVDLDGSCISSDCLRKGHKNDRSETRNQT